MEFQINAYTIRYAESMLAWDVLDANGRLIATFRTIHDARAWATTH